MICRHSLLNSKRSFKILSLFQQKPYNSGISALFNKSDEDFTPSPSPLPLQGGEDKGEGELSLELSERGISFKNLFKRKGDL